MVICMTLRGDIYIVAPILRLHAVFRIGTPAGDGEPGAFQAVRFGASRCQRLNRHLEIA